MASSQRLASEGKQRSLVDGTVSKTWLRVVHEEPAIKKPRTTAAMNARECERMLIDLRSNINIPDMGDLDSVFVIEDMIEPELTDSTMLKYAEVRGCRDNDLYIQEGNRLMIFDAADGRCLRRLITRRRPGRISYALQSMDVAIDRQLLGPISPAARSLTIALTELRRRAQSEIIVRNRSRGRLLAGPDREQRSSIAVKSYDSDLNFIDSISTSITPDQYRAQYLFLSMGIQA